MHDALLHWYPPVGVFIALLGVLGIVVPLIRDLAKMGKWEKAIWTFVMFALMLLEIRSIYLDRRAHDVEQATARAEQLQHFNEIGEGIKGAVAESQKQFAATMQRSNSILGGVSESIKIATGGDGYCWLVPESPLPVGVGGDAAYQGNNWWQLGLRSSGTVVLPTCDLRFMPFPTDKELKEGIAPNPSFLTYHFEKVPVMSRPYFRTTANYIKGDRIYSGVIETPTRTFIEVIKFEPDPKDPSRYIPKCMVALPAGTTLENDCNPQK
jgi:hypothetical protein